MVRHLTRFLTEVLFKVFKIPLLSRNGIHKRMTKKKSSKKDYFNTFIGAILTGIKQKSHVTGLNNTGNLTNENRNRCKLIGNRETNERTRHKQTRGIWTQKTEPKQNITHCQKVISAQNKCSLFKWSSKYMYYIYSCLTHEIMSFF